MTKNSPEQLWFQRYLEFHCDDCGSDIGFRSRRRTFSERYLASGVFAAASALRRMLSGEITD